MEQYIQMATGQGGGGQMVSQGSQAVPGMPGAQGGMPREGNVQNDAMYQEADNLLQGYKVRNPPNQLV
jgi:hypothetical protein